MSGIAETVVASRPTWPTLASFVRTRVQRGLQQVLEEEVDAVLGRHKGERRTGDAASGYRNGYGNPRQLALRGLLGDAAPLSASAVQRLTHDRQTQYATWKARDLSKLALGYVGADGIYVKAGLESSKAALLHDGRRRVGPVGAVAQVWPTRAEQRCWNHTRRHVVDAVPLKQQPSVLADVQTIAAAESRAEAQTARRAFHHTYRLRFPNASERLDRDWARMLTYCDFPNDHWRHLRTTNVVESP